MNKRIPSTLNFIAAVAIVFAAGPNAGAETFAGDAQSARASDLDSQLAALSERVARMEGALTDMKRPSHCSIMKRTSGSVAITPMDYVMGISPLLSQSALPGHPGGSHLYHIGAFSDFFLDHSAYIRLSDQQKVLLNGIKEQALLARREWFRKLDRAEEQLWELTSSDQPDAAQVEAKVRELERLRGDQRLSAINAVGGAVKALNSEQIEKLIGEPNSLAPSGDSPSDKP